MRLGARYNYAITDYVKPYAGASWEYEFDGKTEYSLYNFTAATPSLGGSTGVFELGITLGKSAQYKALSFDFGIEAYAGVRKGVGGKVQLAYAF